MKCKICGNEKISVVYNGRIRDGKLEHYTNSDVEIYKCDHCKVMWHEPIMNLEQYYESTEYRKSLEGSTDEETFYRLHDKETIEQLFEHNEGLMIQEFLDGQEIGADVYIDLISKNVVSIFTKKKIKMRAGETDKAVSFKDEKLFELIKKFVGEAGYEGQIDIDIFDINGEYYISEVNPRFGGGYPHAYECGADHISMIVNNLEGNVNQENVGNYQENVYMMKYNEVMIMKKEEEKDEK